MTGKKLQYAQPPPGTYAPSDNQPPMMVPTSLPPTSTPFSEAQMPPPPPTTGFNPSPPISQPYQSGQVPPGGAPVIPYIPVQHHWFYCREISERKIWEPFSWDDSFRLEEAFRNGLEM
jgi:hypothetical protein